MSKKLFKPIVLAIATIMVLSILAGCVSKNNEEAAPTTNASVESTESAPQYYYDMLDQVQDSSELPDWKGSQLSLSVWDGHGAGDAERTKAQQDVVSPEVKRVTGVEINVDKSFDNIGQTYANKMSMLAASGDWPHLVMRGEEIKSLVDAGKLYDLTDLIPQYCPNLMKKIPMDTMASVYNRATINGGQGGKIYAFPSQLPPEYISVVDTTIDKGQFSYVKPLQDPNLYAYIWVRDDILKKIFPNAKTQKEIEELYMQNGKFLEAEILDVPINSKEEFYQFLYKIKELIDTGNLREGNKKVEVTYAAQGADNWGLLVCLDGILTGRTTLNNYYTYFDKRTGNVELMLNQDWFKQDLKGYVKLVQDGVMSKESLLDNAASFTEKLNNGLYAVTYGWNVPDASLLEQQNKPYQYRKIFLDIPVDTQNFEIFSEPAKTDFNIAIFKDSVKQEDLPQVLRYLDFMVSDIGEKLVYWGPKTAGLWEEKDGKRIYTDKDLEDCMVYGKDNGRNAYYNLYNEWAKNKTAWPQYTTYAWGGGKFHPRYTYERVRNVAETDMFFAIAQLEGRSYEAVKKPVALTADIWNYFADVPDTDKFFKAKDGVEKAIMKVLTSKNDDEFEKFYSEVLDYIKMNGFSTETRDKVTKIFKDANADYLK